jgi:hypothetical protein
VAVLLSPAPALAQKPDPLAQARLFYNQRNFDGAIAAAEQARRVPARADSADLVAARAFLERYRDSAASDDLTNARERLRRIDPQRFNAQERLELIVGLGETLYFDQSYGGAAELFESALDAGGGLSEDGREQVLDWWATARDREPRAREVERQAGYERIRSRMQRELAARPTSAVASYWLAAAARGKGDLDAAWGSAEAGWVRASLVPGRGAALRADLDRLMQRAIIPERAKAMSRPAEALRLDWEKFKERWKSP